MATIVGTSLKTFKIHEKEEAFLASNVGRIKRGNRIVTQKQRIVSTDLRLHVDLKLPRHRQRGVDDLVRLAINNDADQRILLPYIIHNDGDVSNLRPATTEENALHLTNLLDGELGEIFRPIQLIGGVDMTHYLVSDQGRVRNTRSGRILRNSAGYFGYLAVRINGRTFKVNRLVASTFIENNDPQRLIYVDHIDGVRTNNFAANLRWVTPQQNTSFSHAVRMRAYRADLSQQHIFNAINDARNFRFNDRRIPITTIKDYMRRGVPIHGWYFVRETDAGTQRAEKSGRSPVKCRVDIPRMFVGLRIPWFKIESIIK